MDTASMRFEKGWSSVSPFMRMKVRETVSPKVRLSKRFGNRHDSLLSHACYFTLAFTMNTLSRREEDTLLKTTKERALRECDEYVKGASLLLDAMLCPS